MTPLLVEFTGCTGSGKTRLAAQVRALLIHAGVDARSPEEILPASRLLASVRNPSLRNVVADLLFAPFAMRGIRRWTAFSRTVARQAVRYADSPAVAVSVIRSVWRKIAVHEVLRHGSVTAEVVLVDEGILHAAHNVFVQAKTPPREGDLAEFFRLAPRPDLAFCVRAPEEVVRLRTRLRPDPPRPRGRGDWIAAYVANGVRLYDRIGDLPGLRSWWMPADGGDPGTCDRVIGRIMERNRDAGSR